MNDHKMKRLAKAKLRKRAGCTAACLLLALSSGCSAKTPLQVSVQYPAKLVETISRVDNGYIVRYALQGYILPGISCMGIDLSGMNREQAIAAITEKLGNVVEEKKITLIYKDKQWEYTAADFDFSFDPEKLVEDALSFSRVDGSIDEEKIDKIFNEGFDIAASADYSEEKIKEAVAAVAKELDCEPKDAKPTFKDGKCEISEEKIGLKVNREVVNAKIEKALQSSEADTSVELVVSEVKPQYTKKELETDYSVIGEYTTYYDASVTDREKNLIRASELINGTILMPGDEFNYNQAVSPVTVENGYAYANVIVGYDYVPGIGGGLCQGSTTIYNAVIRAELEITERNEHSFPAHYVPIGLDAMVYTEGIYNFRFVNDSGYPIYIAMFSGDGAMTVTLYGHEIHDPSRQVSWDSTVVEYLDRPKDKEIEDPTLPAGTRVLVSSGETGCVVDTYKTITEKGATTTEYFTKSVYESSPDVYKVGTQKPSGGDSGHGSGAGSGSGGTGGSGSGSGGSTTPPTESSTTEESSTAAEESSSTPEESGTTTEESSSSSEESSEGGN